MKREKMIVSLLCVCVCVCMCVCVCVCVFVCVYHSRCFVVRSCFVKVCYATVTLTMSPDKHHRYCVTPVHRDTQAEHHRDEHRDLQAELEQDHAALPDKHHRHCVTAVHRDTQAEHHRDERT